MSVSTIAGPCSRPKAPEAVVPAFEYRGMRPPGAGKVYSRAYPGDHVTIATGTYNLATPFYEQMQHTEDVSSFEFIEADFYVSANRDKRTCSAAN